MTEGTLSLAARRMRRQRRLEQRVRRPAGAASVVWDRSLAAALAIFFGITVSLLALLLRGAGSPAAVREASPSDSTTSTPDALRPPLAPASDTVPMPAAYMVEPGDTLLSIALRLGSSVEAITLASGLEDADFIRDGQTLAIPPSASVLEPVEPTLTLLEIAALHNALPEVLAAYNGLRLEALDQELGRRIVVFPPGGITSQRNPLLADSKVRAPAPVENLAVAGVTYYVVEEGDTLLAIAEKLGVDAETLLTENGLADSDAIVAGEELRVPLWSRPAHEVGEPSAEAEVAFAAATVEVAQRAEQSMAPIVYEIEPGDTLEGVAWRFGVDVYTLVNNNNVTHPDVIRPGEQITILPVSGLLYTVEPGDTLEGIARTFKVDLGPIIDFNYLEDIDFITVGMELILPGAAPLPPPPPPPARAASTTYQVSAGDTIISIARRFGVDADDIVAANGLPNADRIAIGDVLKIAPAAAAPRAQPQQVTRNLPVPGPAAASAPGQAPSGGGGNLVSTAMQYRGARYVFGGTTPAGFDCSGFVYYVFNRSGKPISRGMWGQYNAGYHPGRGDLQPGDIVFFQNTYMPGLSHNGIYIGGGQFIHASDPSSGVKVSGLSDPYWASRWFGATRV